MIYKNKKKKRTILTNHPLLSIFPFGKDVVYLTTTFFTSQVPDFSVELIYLKANCILPPR